MMKKIIDGDDDNDDDDNEDDVDNDDDYNFVIYLPPQYEHDHLS